MTSPIDNTFLELCNIDLTVTTPECQICNTSKHVILDFFDGGYLCKKCGNGIEHPKEKKQNKIRCSNCNTFRNYTFHNRGYMCNLCHHIILMKTIYKKDLDYILREEMTRKEYC